jgi:tetratricopeptide (TPR) repeat protein
MKKILFILFFISPLFSFSQIQRFNVTIGEANGQEKQYLDGKFRDNNCKHEGSCPKKYDNPDNPNASCDQTRALVGSSPRSAARQWAATGNYRGKNNDYQLAMVDFGIALKIDKNYAHIYFLRGNVKYNRKDYAGSIKDYTDYLKLLNSPNRSKLSVDPVDQEADAYYNRAQAKYNMGDYVGCCNDLRKAGELGQSKAYSEIQRKCN